MARMDSALSAAREAAKKRSLTRLVIPFSLTASIEGWLLRNPALASRSREKALVAWLEQRLGVPVARAAELAGSRTSPVFEALVEHLSGGGQCAGTGDVAARAALPGADAACTGAGGPHWPAHVWRRVRDATDLEAVLLPQVLRSVFGGEEGAAQVVRFELDEACMKQWYGNLVFVTPLKEFQRGDDGPAKRQVKKPLQRTKGFACVLGGVRLTLSSVGVAMLEIDLHLAEETQGESAAASNAALLEMIERFNYLVQLVRPEHQEDKLPIFADIRSVALGYAGGQLGGVRSAVIDDVCSDLSGDVVEQLGALTAGDQQGSAAGAGSSAGWARGWARRRLEVYGRAWVDAVTREGGQAAAGSEAMATQADLYALVQGNLPDVNPAVWPNAAALWAAESEKVKPDGERRLSAEDRARLHAAVEAAAARLPDALKARFLLGRPPSRERAHRPGEAWSVETILRQVLGDLGVDVAAEDWHRVLLDGDRAFLFTHLRLENTEAGGNVVQYGAQAIRIARRQNKDFNELDDDEDHVAGTRFGVSRALMYTCALEGICVLQADGKNAEHADHLKVVRNRHYTLGWFALLYRFALLDITILGVTNQGLTGDRELRRIERLNGRVEHFTHWLYHGNISNMTHLQALFDFFQRQLQVPRLWEDVQRDLPRHMERLEHIEKRKLARRRGWIDVVASIVAATIVIKEVTELLRQFQIDLPGWFLETTGTRWVGFAVLPLVGVALVGGARLVLARLHDKVAPID